MDQIYSVKEIAKKVCPAVITIVISKDMPKIEGFYLLPYAGKDIIMPKIEKNKREMTKIGGGSGFIVSEDGYILTSCHVVEDPTAEYTIIVEPTKTYQAKVIARDPINDIAILKIKASGLPWLNMGDSTNIELGEEVVAVGNALGEFHDTVSRGIVSGLSRFIQATNSMTNQAERLRGLIQTDAAINPGNSGGPLINVNCDVIGINTAMVMGAQNLGFAIPINYAKKDLEEVKKYGKIKVPFMGIKYVLINDELADKNKLPVKYGALVVREVLGESPVVKDSSADKAGVKEFDIILEAKGEKIDTKNTLSHILSKCGIGEDIELKVLRDKKQITLKIKLSEKI